MFAIAGAKAVSVVLEVSTVIVLLDFNYSFKCAFERLTVVSKPSLQVHCVFLITELRYHKFGGSSTKRGTFRMIVFHHSKLIDPQNAPQALYISSLIIGYKIPYKKALVFALNKLIVTFC